MRPWFFMAQSSELEADDFFCPRITLSGANDGYGFARSAFGVRGVLAPLLSPRFLQSKATRRRVALRKLRDTEQESWLSFDDRV
jgi:hypothetical protein